MSTRSEFLKAVAAAYDTATSPEHALPQVRDVPQELPARVRIQDHLRRMNDDATYVVPVPAGKQPLWFAAWLKSDLDQAFPTGGPEVAVSFTGTVTVRLNPSHSPDRPDYPRS